MVRLVNWYVERLHRAAHTDATLALAFQRVANLLAPPASILAPNLALRVLRGNLRRALARPTSELPQASARLAPTNREAQ